MSRRRSPGGSVEDRYHRPVLVEEVLDLLLPGPAGFGGGGLFLDGTVGGGGHAAALLERCPGCRLVGTDRDPDALEAAARRLEPLGERVRLLRLSFHEAPDWLERRGERPAGALLDLGVSSHQIERGTRGFSFREGTPLDMRMAGGEEGRKTAADLLNRGTREELARIFKEYGEEPRGRRLAREIVRRREERPFERSEDLVSALASALRKSPEPGEKARIFQALRIAVNDELETLERGLPAIRDVLEVEGVMAVIAYHSLEDRIVKHAFRDWSRSCVCPPGLPVCRCRGHALGETLTRKPVRPSEPEVQRNPRSRSARLRAWRRGP